MSTQDENETMAPMPALESEKTLPTKIHEVDERIEFLKNEISNLQIQLAEATFDRKTMIARAKEIVCIDDGKWKIVDVPIYPKKHVDVDVLKKDYEDKYKQILGNIRERIRDKINLEIEKADSFISQNDVKSVVKDKMALTRIIPEPTTPERWDTVVVERK